MTLIPANKSLDGEWIGGRCAQKCLKFVIMNEDTDSDTATIEKVRHWLPNLGLTFQDKFLTQNGNWLNDNHMRATHDLAKCQFKDINGF